ncbi:hypothetical protein FACS1894187_23720 [Synergistales bacterium]|nr:hypothetical protein AGMMS50276_28060 [Synergistales bacterium]GHV41790.1 hypothetical protein FACS1894187_23720 [Synergistales bacterium]
MTYSSSFETNATAKNNGVFLNAGLFSIMHLYEGMGLDDVVNESLGVRSDKGYSDSDHVLPADTHAD